MKKIILILFGILLVGCATTKGSCDAYGDNDNTIESYEDLASK